MNTDHPTCLECDYNLTGLTSDRCPECGWHINPSLLAFAQRTEWHGSRRWPLILLAILGGIAAFVVLLNRPSGTTPGQRMMQWFHVINLFTFTMHFEMARLGFRQETRPVRGPRVGRLGLIVATSQVVYAAVYVSYYSSLQSPGLIGYLVAFVLTASPGLLLITCSFIVSGTRREWVDRLKTELARKSRQLADGATFDVDAFGWFPAEAMEVVFDDTPRETNPAIDALIESTWKDKLQTAEAEKRELYDGLQGRLIKSEVLVNKNDAAQPASRANAMRLVLGTTCYRDFVGTNLYNAHLAEKYGLASLANPLGTSAVVITADGYLLYGRRSDRVVFHAGYLHTFGGSLEAADRTEDGSFDVFGAIRRELHEELHLAESGITELVCTGLVRDHQIMQPELLFDASVSVTRDDLLARFDAETDPEHDAIEACYDEPYSILPFIEGAGRMAPVAVASIMLHGRFHWGRDWYDQTAFVLFGELPPEKSVRP